MRKIACSLALILTLLTTAYISPDVCAQQADRKSDSLYHVEAYGLAGPMATFFFRKRVIPEDANNVTLGYSFIIRLLWHPNHLISIGLMTGYQKVVSEQYIVRDFPSDVDVKGELTAVPVMTDVSLRKYGIEMGASIGFFIFTSRVTEGTIALGRRIELGSIFHGAYYVPLDNKFSIGGELFISFAGYRGIIGISPQILLKYDLFSY